jgi:rRNA-processing protein FCF1
MLRGFGNEYFEGRVFSTRVLQEMHRQLADFPMESEDHKARNLIVKQFVSGELNYLQAANAIQELKDTRMQMELEKQRRQQEFAKPAPWERDQKRDMSDEAVHARVAKMCRRSG